MMKRKNIYWGLILILVGLTMVLNIMGVFGGFSIFRLAWSIIFASLVLNSLYKWNFISASLYSAILAHINAEVLGLKGNIFLIYVASILIGFGLNILLSRRRFFNKINPKIIINDEVHNFSNFEALKREYESRKTDGDLKGQHVSFENNFGSSVRYIKSTNLKSARIENNLGTSNVYFNDATFSDEGCIIDVECNLGKVNIYLPQEINYQNNIAQAMGSINSGPSFHADDTYPTVFLQGEVNFGEINIVIV